MKDFLKLWAVITGLILLLFGGAWVLGMILPLLPEVVLYVAGFLGVTAFLTLMLWATVNL